MRFPDRVVRALHQPIVGTLLVFFIAPNAAWAQRSRVEQPVIAFAPGRDFTSLPKIDSASRDRLSRIKGLYGSLPLSFEANRGQARAGVKFLTRGSGYTLALAPAEAVFT